LSEQEQLGICLNLAKFYPSQYAGYNFNSFCELDGRYLAANADGIFILDNADTDNGTEIEAFIESFLLDLGTQIRIRKVYLGYETNGTLILKVKDNEGNERTYTITPIDDDRLQHDERVRIGRDGKGRYWSFRIENVDGCDFSMDSMEIVPIYLGKKPKGKG
jgi:hypothetical protein